MKIRWAYARVGSIPTARTILAGCRSGHVALTFLVMNMVMGQSLGLTCIFRRGNPNSRLLVVTKRASYLCYSCPILANVTDKFGKNSSSGELPKQQRFDEETNFLP
jgi:hypothetical protein